MGRASRLPTLGCSHCSRRFVPERGIVASSSAGRGEPGRGSDLSRPEGIPRIQLGGTSCWPIEAGGLLESLGQVMHLPPGRPGWRGSSSSAHRPVRTYVTKAGPPPPACVGGFSPCARPLIRKPARAGITFHQFAASCCSLHRQREFVDWSKAWLQLRPTPLRACSSGAVAGATEL